MMDFSNDFKDLSLQYYWKEVEVTFKKNTEGHKKYGDLLIGKLVGRTWGESLHTRSQHTVIAISILAGSEEHELSCDEILTIKGANAR